MTVIKLFAVVFLLMLSWFSVCNPRNTHSLRSDVAILPSALFHPNLFPAKKDSTQSDMLNLETAA